MTSKLASLTSLMPHATSSSSYGLTTRKHQAIIETYLKRGSSLPCPFPTFCEWLQLDPIFEYGIMVKMKVVENGAPMLERDLAYFLYTLDPTLVDNAYQPWLGDLQTQCNLYLQIYGKFIESETLKLAPSQLDLMHSMLAAFFKIRTPVPPMFSAFDRKIFTCKLSHPPTTTNS